VSLACPVRWLLLISCLLLTASCHRSQPRTATRYHFTGRIISIDAEDQSAVVDGDNVSGFMDPMVMVYKIKPPARLSQLSPGDAIAADLIDNPRDDNGRSSYWLENVTVTAHSETPPAPVATQRIPATGDTVPDFSVTNQDGKKISLREYRGMVLLVTFIYTRCPFPDFCPRMSSNFAAVDKQLATDPSLGRVHLLTISFDPEHDTPKVLRDYAFSVAHTHESALFRRWEFAAPAVQDLPRIARSFGLVYKAENGLITHNLSTTVIGPDGKIAKWYHGGDWQVSDLIRDATSLLASKD
jgi:protein SCO1/2